MVYIIQSYRLVLVIFLVQLVVGKLLITNRKGYVYKNIINLEVSANIPAQEIFALQELYLSTRGDEWTWRNSSHGVPWNFTANCNPCEEHWQGLTCIFDAQDASQHIVDISLMYYQLNGTLPTALVMLSKLERFVVSYNNIFGTIPPCLGNATALQYLQLSYNNLTGTIPASLGQLHNLKYLWLYNNTELTGSIPAELGDLSMLQELDLGHTALTGTIPASFGQLHSLNFLWLFYNPELTGSIPVELGNLSELIELYLGHTALIGTIPATLGQLHKLKVLWLEYNTLTGPIPTELGNLSKLRQLDLGFTSLTGTIPASLGQLHSLEVLWLEYNAELTGPIPAEMGNLSNLRQLDLSFTAITGTIPATLGQLHNLQILWLESNSQLIGPIPTELSHLSKLIELDLSESSLTGTIPASLGNLTLLTIALLDDNFLTGSVPGSFGQLAQLGQLYLDHNLLSGSLPASLSAMTNLLELHLQNNKLSGTLDGIFSSDTQQSLHYVDVSDNQLTGHLPIEAFQLPDLKTFEAVRNCFSGTLSETICSNPSLVSLILDGLLSAPSCQQRLLPHTSSRSYSTVSSFSGRIPSCLFNMPSLISLHLSGNGLTGSLPEDLVLSDRLVDLTLSHNALTGSIPRAIQRRMWKNLDLSYNRLSGVLDSDFAAQKIYFSLTQGGKTYSLTDAEFPTTYSLQNNRLSRTVPGTLVNRLNVSLLGSNMFECNLQKSDLPQHDDQRSNYQCGSDSFDSPFYLWLAVCFALVVFIAASVWCISAVKRSAMVTNVLECLQKWNLPKEELPRNFRYVSAMGDILCQVSVWCTALVVLVMVPWYTAASHYYGTYTHQYAWTVSAAFLSGPETTAVKLVVYVLVLAVMVGALVLLLVRYDREQHHVRSRLDTCNKEGRYELTLDEPRTLAQRLFMYWAFATVNIAVVGGVNVAFVLISLTKSNRALVLAQIGLSLFKLGWNTTVTPFLIQSLSAYISPTAQSTGFVAVQVVMALFNNIAMPCLIVAVISPSCFYAVFHPASTVNSLFIVLTCTEINALGQCLDYDPEVSQTSYAPPFRYDYQCSSSFVTYYAPAFVYLGIAAAFAVPVIKMAVQQLQKRCVVDGALYRMLNLAMPRILQPLSVVLPSGEVVCTYRRDAVDSNAADSTATESFSFSRSSRAWVQYETLQRDLFRPVFDANIFVISLVTYLGILLTFGVVFPPLAVVMCVTMLSVAWQAKLTVGRFLCVTRELRLYKFEEIIEQECVGAATVMKLRQSVALIVVCSCCFYALFLFDTLGNAQGWGRAYWVLIVMPVLPLCCLLMGYAVHRRRRGELFRDSSYMEGEQGRAVELMEPAAQSKQSGSEAAGEAAGEGGGQDAVAADGDAAEDIEDCTVSALHE